MSTFVALTLRKPRSVGQPIVVVRGCTSPPLGNLRFECRGLETVCDEIHECRLDEGVHCNFAFDIKVLEELLAAAVDLPFRPPLGLSLSKRPGALFGKLLGPLRSSSGCSFRAHQLQSPQEHSRSHFEILCSFNLPSDVFRPNVEEAIALVGLLCGLILELAPGEGHEELLGLSESCGKRFVLLVPNHVKKNLWF